MVSFGYEAGDPVGHGSGNSRNGHGRKSVLTTAGRVELDDPPGPQRHLGAGDRAELRTRVGQVEDVIFSLWLIRQVGMTRLGPHCM